MARLKKLAECWTERTRTAGVIGAWVKGWMASALLATEKNFRKIMGYRDLWTFGCDPQWIEVCHPTGGGVVRWRRPPRFNSQRARATYHGRIFLTKQHVVRAVRLLVDVLGAYQVVHLVSPLAPARRLVHTPIGKDEGSLKEVPTDSVAEAVSEKWPRIYGVFHEGAD